MIHISPPSHVLSKAFLDHPGGFAWWYTDLVDDAGNGVVIIWSYGLPFLPGYASAERAGRPQIPRDRPSINVAVYTDHKLDFYLLQELPGEQGLWSHDDHWEFGQSRFHSRVEGGRRRLNIELDLEVPGSPHRFVGRLALDGVARAGLDGEAPNDSHDWSPLTGPTHGRLDASMGDRTWRIEGRAYHDRNGGLTPMHQQMILSWMWGRLAFPDFERIYYLTWSKHPETPPQYHGLDILADGTTVLVPDLQVACEDFAKSYAGPRYPRRIQLSTPEGPWLDVHTDHVFDEGPFYMRFFAQGSANGQTASGVAELVIPDKIDTDFMRPLVKMRVHQAAGANSMWLPLFTGPRRGRVTRLLKSWLP